MSFTSILSLLWLWDKVCGFIQLCSLSLKSKRVVKCAVIVELHCCSHFNHRLLLILSPLQVRLQDLVLGKSFSNLVLCVLILSSRY